MKNLITILTVLTITISSVFANTTPETLISTSSVEVVMIDNLDFFTAASFDEASDNLVFNMTDNISVIQIFNAEGNLEFQLPIMSNKVKINKNLFSKGTCSLGFILDGQSELHFTQVTIK